MTSTVATTSNAMPWCSETKLTEEFRSERSLWGASETLVQFLNTAGEGINNRGNAIILSIEQTLDSWSETVRRWKEAAQRKWSELNRRNLIHALVALVGQICHMIGKYGNVAAELAAALDTVWELCLVIYVLFGIYIAVDP